MQIAVIEYSRNVLGIKEANTKEINKNLDFVFDVITTMDEANYEELGNTMRLGAQKCYIKDENSLAFKIYNSHEISERHRHRYEVNGNFVEQLESKGLIFSGRDKTNTRMEMCEIPTHPFFIAVQFHPEYKTSPFTPAPLYYSFVLAASNQYEKFNIWTKSREYGISSIVNTHDDVEISSINPKYDKMYKIIMKTYENMKSIVNEHSSPENIIKKDEVLNSEINLNDNCGENIVKKDGLVLAEK